MIRQFIQPDGLTLKTFRQGTPPLNGAVGDRHLLRLLGAEMCRAQFDHLTGTDEQDALTGDRIENPFRQMHARCGHRNNICANGRGATHLLGHGKCPLKQLVQLRTQRADFFGSAHRLLHLPQNLRLTNDHRVEATSHPERMPDRLGLVMHIQKGGKLVVSHLMIGTEPIDHAL